MLVNRRCEATDTQTISVTTDKTDQAYQIEDKLTGECYVTSDGIFRNISIEPGGGRLFELRPIFENNEIWSDTVNVSSDIIVPAGKTLTILPSTVIQFASGTHLTINGTLNADGAMFTSASSNPGSGDWYGIVFDNADNNSYIKNSTIEYATYGIECIDCSPMIGESGKPNTLQYNSSNGVRCHQASPAISYNTIQHNGIGIYCEYNSNPDLAPNYIIDNNSYGIFCTQTCNPYIRHNEIGNNGPGVMTCLRFR